MSGEIKQIAWLVLAIAAVAASSLIATSINGGPSLPNEPDTPTPYLAP